MDAGISDTGLFVVILHIPGAAQALESVFGLVIHGPAGPLGRPGYFQFGNDLVDAGSAAVHREGDVLLTQRAVTLAVTGKVQRNDGNFLALGITPDVQFGP